MYKSDHFIKHCNYRRALVAEPIIWEKYVKYKMTVTIRFRAM